MKWNEQLTDKLKELCYQGKTNAEIADILRCKLTDVYAKRSQLGTTIAKCKGIEPNPEFENAIEAVKPRGMTKDVRDAFKTLGDAVLFSMARDWVSMKDADEYVLLANELIALEAKYNAQIGR